MKAGEAIIFRGGCDASGIVSLGDDLFAVGTDEGNSLRTYRLGGDGQPLATLAVDEFLGAKWSKKDECFKECDIEGATRLGELTIWITSHARNASGGEKPERQRLFALKVAADGRLEPWGTPYSGLLGDLLAEKRLARWRLSKAAARPPQKKNGFNIEAVCVSPEGTLWIGFRNPVRKGRALLVEIVNPLALIEGREKRARLGRLKKLDLGGRGVRDLVRWKDGYLVLAGSFDDKRRFALYRWNGDARPPVRLDVDLNGTGLAPEGLLWVGEERILIASDDDAVLTSGGLNGKLQPESARTFRALILNLAGKGA